MASPFEIQWYGMDYDPSASRSKIRSEVLNLQYPIGLTSGAVYVIRLKPPFSIQYPLKHTPVLYIGEGELIQRLDAHRQWAEKFQKLGFAFPFEVRFCYPKVRNNLIAYREFEGYLLKIFIERYGSLPLKNKNREKPNEKYIYSRKAISDAIGPGSGNLYNWAIQPLSLNSFYEVFARTHK